MPRTSGTPERHGEIVASEPNILAAGLTKDDAEALATGACADPFRLLGPHPIKGGRVIRTVMPGAETVEAVAGGKVISVLEQVADHVFSGKVEGADRPGAYTLRARAGGAVWEEEDPYRFGPLIGELDEHLISEGGHLDLWHVLGARILHHEGVDGVGFAVWAPGASRVSVVGPFNHWDGRRHPMRPRGTTGVWELFLPGLTDGVAYKYEIRAADGTVLPQKADPVGIGAEHPPATASLVRKLGQRNWRDGDWMESRATAHQVDAPISIYEVHLASWRLRAAEGNRPLSYWELADELVDYVSEMGFTHIELLPISEYPFDGSWGYQPVGLYAPTIRHGTAEEFRHFVDRCHQAGIGVILDWVPGHFPADAHGLARFDGTALYEHEDPREGFHQDWNTLIYNYGRREVQNYLVANALYWLKEYHLDGLRVDAVASMLYRDYSRAEGQWIPNVHGGRENLEAIAFLKRMNEVVYGADPSILTIAEESTAWPGVTRPNNHGGLGFGYKWNMGWMNDTLSYVSKDPIHRRFHHHQMTFGLHYAFTENFVLPISHDEVVHGKGSLLAKMPGNGSDQFANLRAYLGFMWAHPGKKLLFMGQEFAQPAEWSHQAELPWHLLDDPRHAGVRRLVRDLNTLYRGAPALHRGDCKAEGFAWIEANAEDISVYAWERHAAGAPPIVAICNFTPVERTLRMGVPEAGRWIERLNTDAEIYGGEGRGNLGGLTSKNISSHGRAHSIQLRVPPLATLMFELDMTPD
ncbi:MAG: 1,4-alpha-glucan branching protein GlgB [Pseudomonadota bacterium]